MSSRKRTYSLLGTEHAGAGAAGVCFSFLNCLERCLVCVDPPTKGNTTAAPLLRCSVVGLLR
jgi:hypothetical protein